MLLSTLSMPNCSTDLIKNIGYAVSGYDIYKGNPLASGTDGAHHTDPGLRGDIYQLEYNGATTQDRRYCIPDGVSIKNCDGCKYSFETSVITGMHSYTEKLSLHVGVKGETVAGSFGASSEYETVKEKTSSSKNIYVATDTTCCAYRYDLKTYNPPKLHPNFLKGIESLPEQFEHKSYDK